MNVEVQVRSLSGLPTLSGPHELSWNYILDKVFADAFEHGLTELEIVLPSNALLETTKLRAQLTRSKEVIPKKGLALLAGEIPVLSEKYARLYLLEFGRLAPSALRRPVVLPATWKREHRTSIFSLQSKLLGIPIRVTEFLKRRDWTDRAGFKMRQSFASSTDVPAYYHLSTWHLSTWRCANG
jgi:hypothetical protein